MTFIKICGITNGEDAAAAVEAGADMLGFVFYPASPRFVAPARAREIIRGLRQGGTAPRMVGVFVNAGPALVKEVAETCELDWAQVHGDLAPVLAVKQTMPGARPLHIYPSLRPREPEEARRLAREVGVTAPDRPAFLVDAPHKELYGGTGERADWEVARVLAAEFPLLLAGGLTPANVGEAVARVRPWGVDVASGVEARPGLKDYDKLRRFVRAAGAVER